MEGEMRESSKIRKKVKRGEGGRERGEIRITHKAAKNDKEIETNHSLSV